MPHHSNHKHLRHDHPQQNQCGNDSQDCENHRNGLAKLFRYILYVRQRRINLIEAILQIAETRINARGHLIHALDPISLAVPNCGETAFKLVHAAAHLIHRCADVLLRGFAQRRQIHARNAIE